MNSDDQECCGPFSKPSSKEFGLPSHGKFDSDSTPNLLAVDRAIEERYGKPGDDQAGVTLKGPGNPRFEGPGKL